MTISAIFTAGDRALSMCESITAQWKSRKRKPTMKTNKIVSHRSQGKTMGIKTVLLMATMGSTIAYAGIDKASPNEATFDSDAIMLHVDNCASRCVTNSLKDFIRPPRIVKGRVEGLGGQKVAVRAIGTIKWTFEDDNGASHSFPIPGSLYVPDSPARLFSPQHWAQTQRDDIPLKDSTWQATMANHIELHWGQRQYSRNIKYNAANVATFWKSPGSRKYQRFKATFCKEVNKACQEPVTFNTTVVTDDEAEEWERDGGEQWPPRFDNDDGQQDDDDPPGKTPEPEPLPTHEQGTTNIIREHRPGATQEYWERAKDTESGPTKF